MGKRSLACLAGVICMGATLSGACGAFSGSDAAPDHPSDAGSDATMVGDLDATGVTVDDAGIDPVDSAPGCGPADGGFCATLDGGAFCADFDNPGCPLLGFPSVAKGAYSFEFNTAHSQSRPASLHCTQTSSASQTGAWGPTVDVPIPKGTTRVEVDLYFRITTVPGIKTADGDAPRLSPFHLDATGSGGPTVDFYLESDKSYFQFGPAATINYSSNGPTAKTLTWYPLVMLFELDPVKPATTFTGTFDGMIISAKQSLGTPLQGGQTLTMTVGYEPFKLTGGEMYVDNVVVRISP